MPCVRNEKTLKKCTKDSAKNLTSLTEIIKDYQETCSEEAYEAKRAINPNDKDLCRFMHYDLNGVLEMKDQGIKEIISRCICNRNRHQYCISNEAVNTATEKLMDAKSLYPYSSHINKEFEYLYDKLKGIIGTVKGIGNSTLYDACIRLGWSYSPQIKPQHYVYVHRKLIKSAEAILGDKFSRIKEADRPAILRQKFIEAKKEFAELSALDIENLLCIYHKEILTIQGFSPIKKA